MKEVVRLDEHTKDWYLPDIWNKPSFSDITGQNLWNPAPIAFLRMTLPTLSILGALPFFSLVCTMWIRVSGSTSATMLLSSSVSVTLSWSESNGVKWYEWAPTNLLMQSKCDFQNRWLSMPKFLSTLLAKSWAFSGLVLAVLLPSLSTG